MVSEDNTEILSSTTDSSIRDESNKSPIQEGVSARPKQDRSRKRQKTDVSDRELLETILKMDQPASQPQDDIDLFTKSVAQTMRRLNPQKQAWVKIKIDELLFSAEFGDSVDTAVCRPNDVAAMPQVHQVESEHSLVTVTPDFVNNCTLSHESLLEMAMAECGIPVVNIIGTNQ